MTPRPEWPGLTALALLGLPVLAACGGRVARPVAESTDLDAHLSCDHVESEYRVNLEKIQDLTGEKLGKTDDNIGWILFMPLFLDLSGAEKQEIEALVNRNDHLVELAEQKGCAPLAPIVTSK